MLPTLRQRKVARVLFDEYHGEAWSIRPDVVRAMRPEHPEASSYGRAAAELAERDFEVAALTGPLSAAALVDADVLVIAHPSEAKWERTVGGGSPVFSDDELRAVADFVQDGGGLVVLGETEEDKYGSNLNELLAPFGVRLANTTAFDFSDATMPTWVPAQAAPGLDDRSLLHRVREVKLYRAGTLEADHAGAIVLQTGPSADPPLAGLLAAATYGDGRVVVVADSDLFGDDHLPDHDHRQLWLNVVYWAALAAFRSPPERIVSEAATHPAWLRLRDETNALRSLEGPKGEVDLSKHDGEEVRAHVDAMVDAIGELAPLFPHEQDYLAQVQRDLRAWVDGGCGKPDFMASLALFRPEQHRIDGIQHLVVFPMYTPNGSPDTRFEALIVRTPWPEFVDTLERTMFDNQKYVPVQLVELHERLRQRVRGALPRDGERRGAAHQQLRRHLLRPGERALPVVDGARRRGTPHRAAARRAGARRQRRPGARDLHPVGHDPRPLAQPRRPALRSVHDPPAPALLDVLARGAARGHGDLRLSAASSSARASRSPATCSTRSSSTASCASPSPGNRVRNYDGLGGQLLFAYLHRTGVVQWTDNQLLIDWDRVEDGVAELREQVEELYRRGIDTSKVSYWIAAHDLVAEYVHPNVASQWTGESRVYSDESDPQGLDRPRAGRRVPAERLLRAAQEEAGRRACSCLRRQTGRGRRARRTPGSPPSPATTTPACTPRSSTPSSRPTRGGRRRTATTPGRRPWRSASARSSGRGPGRSPCSTAPAAT